MILVRMLQVATAVVAAVTLAGCPGIPNDGRYQDHDGGRSNTRAEAASPGLRAPS
jgi:hypothetical protein